MFVIVISSVTSASRKSFLVPSVHLSLDLRQSASVFDSSDPPFLVFCATEDMVFTAVRSSVLCVITVNAAIPPR